MIQKARFNKKLTQKELGKLLGVNQSYISKIENRKRLKCILEIIRYAFF